MKDKLFVLLILCLIPACDLNEEILDEVSGERLMKEPCAESNFAASSYGHLNNGFNGSNGLRILNEVAADERVIPVRNNNSWWDGGVWKELHQHTWTSTNWVISMVWDWLDQGVSRTNTGLYFLSQMDSSEEVMHYIAELRFLRALYRYFQLDLFRQAPMRNEFDLDFEQAPIVAKGKDLLYWVETELIEVIPSLRDRDDTPYGRITKATAKMLLSKIYLNAGVYTGSPKWAESLEICNEIINSDQYSINPDYFDIFGVNNHNNAEAIFVIRRDRTAELTPWSFIQSWISSMHVDFIQPQACWNGSAVVSDFLYMWDQDGDTENGIATTDSRFYNDRINPSTGANLGFVMGPQFDPDGSAVADKWYSSPEEFVQLDFTIEFDFNEALYNGGVRVIKYEPDLLTSNLTFSNNDFMIFRYADLWLMAVEAKFRLGNVAEALSDINTLREIRGAPLLSFLTEQDILNERGFELYWEGWRRQDLIRFDQFTRPWANKPQSEKYREVFPIPPGAKASNSKLIQNPGYIN